MIVVKIGGSKGTDAEAALACIPPGTVVVHGGSNEVDTLCRRLGLEVRMVQSPSGHTSRYTDEQTMQAFTMACAGKINKALVCALQRRGINAVGLCGVDGALLRARRKESVRSVENGRQKILHGDFTGSITEINGRLLSLLLQNGFTPVIAPIALSDDGPVNIDGDRAAAEIAGALHAETLVILTNVPGLLNDKADETTLIRSLTASQLDFLQCAEGRMKKKLMAAKEAMGKGVGKVVIADGRVPDAINKALKGAGTAITR